MGERLIECDQSGYYLLFCEEAQNAANTAATTASCSKRLGIPDSAKEMVMHGRLYLRSLLDIIQMVFRICLQPSDRKNKVRIKKGKKSLVRVEHLVIDPETAKSFFEGG